MFTVLLFHQALNIEYLVSRENIEALQEEFQFWDKERSVEITDFEGKKHRVAQYNVKVGEPRPESFRLASPVMYPLMATIVKLRFVMD